MQSEVVVLSDQRRECFFSIRFWTFLRHSYTTLTTSQIQILQMVPLGIRMQDMDVCKIEYHLISRVHLDRTTWIGVNWFTADAIIIAGAVFWQRSRNCDGTK
jgi:hypothetical protein